MEAKILPFKRPHLIIFERFDVEDMAAMFRAKVGDDTYHFTLLADGTLDEVFIRNNALVTDSDDFTEEQRERARRLAREACDIHKDQLATWSKLGPSEQLSLLIAWANETIEQIKISILAACEADVVGYGEEIALMLKDLESHDAYIAGLETAKSLL